ncbi:glucosaminidase domain-containing protein [Marinigracilibium pacificum]|uniref:Mannosyl-glycoprotein endo-beta-N-acetylglucosamidase-like domain-containing protein n=1 Tax=Marinigracilibium pacificum TaxID=2729599 RepID=A0A848J074_9BACT|nr:glucosaminidase domain-containing protein [Marinigracilibium pacificum]NMM49947.1 hypothetical protein [Marinigracilibium pacificum]
MSYKNKYLLILIGCVLIIGSCKRNKVPIITKIELRSLEDVIHIEDSLVKPVLYTNITGLDSLPVDESKTKFVDIILPAILVVKHQILTDKNKVVDLLDKEDWDEEDSLFVKEQQVKFGADSIQDLIVRMETHPNSIVLAQAAVESGWGSSRFFQEANNLFGVWSYDKTEPRIKAESSNVYLRKYETPAGSIEDYFATIGRSFAYKEFRKIRLNNKNVNDLLPHLSKYSERRMAYINQLKRMIEQNDFTKYDNYQIDPEFFE